MPKTIAKETRNLILHSLADECRSVAERSYEVKLNTIMRYGRLRSQWSLKHRAQPRAKSGIKPRL